MENAVDALKIAFAVIVFTMALSLAMFMFTQAKETSDVVLQASDVTEYMEYIEGSGENRIVGLETIIPTLYNYYRENYTVIFLDSDYSFMPLYKTSTDPHYWSESYHNRYFEESEKEWVCSFDANEEQSRREPWTTSGTGGNTIDYYVKMNMDMFLSGGEFKSPSNNGINYDYDNSSQHGWTGSSSFIDNFKNSQFDEYLGWYVYNDTNSSDDGESGEYVSSESALANTKQTKKRVIVYRLRP